MEPRGQEKATGSLPYSMGYNPPPTDRRRNEAGQGNTLPTPNQTLDQNPHPQQLYTHKDSNSNSDPDPAPVTNVTTLASASYSQTAIAAAQPPPPPLAPASGANTTTSTTSSSVRYRECLKNHAASMGGHAFDGCGEFMPSGEEGTPEALRCAACDCHRNFHRKESDGEAQAGTSYYHSHNHTARHNNTTHQIHTQVFRTQPHTSPVTMPPPQHQHQHPHQHQHQQQHKFSRSYSYGLSTSPTGPRMMAFGGNSGGAAAESSSEDLNTFQYTTAGGQAVQQAFSVSKKRIRTKFNQQQKDRMHEFAEKLGWKIQKQDEQEVQQFCNEVGVKRQVFKVWMHNNKQSLKKKER